MLARMKRQTTEKLSDSHISRHAHTFDVNKVSVLHVSGDHSTDIKSAIIIWNDKKCQDEEHTYD